MKIGQQQQQQQQCGGAIDSQSLQQYEKETTSILGQVTLLWVVA